MHWVLKPPQVKCPPFTLTIMKWDLIVIPVSSMPHHIATTARSCPWALKRKVTGLQSPRCQITNRWLESQYNCMPPCNCDQEYLNSHMIEALKCIAEVARSWLCNGLISSLHCHLKCISDCWTLVSVQSVECGPVYAKVCLLFRVKRHVASTTGQSVTNGANYKEGKLHYCSWHSDIRTSNQLNTAPARLSLPFQT